MDTYANKSLQNHRQSAATDVSPKRCADGSAQPFLNKRSKFVAQRKLQAAANNSAQMTQASNWQSMADIYSSHRFQSVQTHEPKSQEGQVVQRAIKDNHAFTNGKLEIDMVPSVRMTNADSYGEEGFIRFTPKPDGDLADEITLVQSVKVLKNGVDKIWDDDEAIREAWKADDGRFVDVSGHELLSHHGGIPASKAYNTALAESGGRSFFGSKRHATAEAPSTLPEVDLKPGYNKGPNGQKLTELWDHPSFGDAADCSFETEIVAKTTRNSKGVCWGSVIWEFKTTKEVDKYQNVIWGIEGEQSRFSDAPSPSHIAAKTRFDDVMGNVGLLSADEIILAKQQFSLPETHAAGTARLEEMCRKLDQYIEKLPADVAGQAWREKLTGIKTGLEAFMVPVVVPDEEGWGSNEDEYPDVKAEQWDKSGSTSSSAEENILPPVVIVDDSDERGWEEIYDEI